MSDTKWYPQDIVDDADSREPWPSKVVRDWYMEGRMVERERAVAEVGRMLSTERLDAQP